MNQESENNSLKNNDSYDTYIGNLSHAINDFHRQIDIYERTNVVSMKNHIEWLEMTNSHDRVDYVELSNIATCFSLAQEDDDCLKNCIISTENETVLRELSDSDEDIDINF